MVMSTSMRMKVATRTNCLMDYATQLVTVATDVRVRSVLKQISTRRGFQAIVDITHNGHFLKASSTVETDAKPPSVLVSDNTTPTQLPKLLKTEEREKKAQNELKENGNNYCLYLL